MWEVLRSYLPENRKKLWDKSFEKKIFFSFRLDRIVMLLIASSIQELPQMLNRWNLPHSNRHGISWCKTQSFIERKRHFSLIWDVNSHSCFLCQGSDVLILFDVQLQTKPLMKRKKVNIIANKVLMLIYIYIWNTQGTKSTKRQSKGFHFRLRNKQSQGKQIQAVSSGVEGITFTLVLWMLYRWALGNLWEPLSVESFFPLTEKGIIFFCQQSPS